MPPKAKVTREDILQKSFDIVQSQGIGSLNARRIAQELSCSTMPIFNAFRDMNELKEELKKRIDDRYTAFTQEYIDKEDYLFTINFAYIQFAREERNLFGALFVEGFVRPRTIEGVIQSSWNRETIECTARQFDISLKKSEELYRDVRFYAHGIATQIYGGNMCMDETEVKELLKNMIGKMRK